MSNLDRLAETLDRWVASSPVSITETPTRLRVNQLDGVQALELVAMIDRIGWVGCEISDRGGEIPRDLLTTAATGVSVEVDKPDAPDGVERILTRTAFAAALARDSLASRLWVHGLPGAVSTLTARISPWEDPTAEVPTEAPADPRRVVRFFKPPTGAQRDLGRWLLREPDAGLPDGEVFAVWRTQAAVALSGALANEVDTDGVLLFRGPPVSRFRPEASADLTSADFTNLQIAAAWVYQNARELENRHGLMAAEITRNASRDGDLRDLGDVTRPAYEGARIAYNFGVNQQSKDTLKALSDLRKAVMDETAKLSETTRSLATAVSSAVFGAIGLVVARLTLAPNNRLVPVAAVIVGLVLAAYVATVIASGLHYLALQRDLRREWRPRLYKFLIDADYEALITQPVARAERGYILAAWAGGVLTLLLVVATLVIVLTPLPSTPATVATTPPAPSTQTSPFNARPSNAPVVSSGDTGRSANAAGAPSREAQAPRTGPTVPGH